MPRQFHCQVACAALAMLVFYSVAVGPIAHAASEAGALQLLRNPAVSDPTLAKMIGKWRGDGTVRQAAGSADEKVNCRLTNGWAANQTLMKLQLACVGIDYRFTATGFIGKAAGSYRGTVSSTTGESAIAAGRGNGNGLSLTLTPTSGQRAPASMSIRLAGRQITNTLTRRDPKTGQTYQALNVTLGR